MRSTYVVFIMGGLNVLFDWESKPDVDVKVKILRCYTKMKKKYIWKVKVEKLRFELEK